MTSTAGDIDVLAEIVGGYTYETLLPTSIVIRLLGHECRAASLRDLIRAKRAAGRPKDLEAVAELEAILEEEDRA